MPISAWQLASGLLGEAGAARAEAHQADVAGDQAHQQKHQGRRPDQVGRPAESG